MTSTRTRLAVLTAAGAVALGGLTLDASPAGAATVANCGSGALTVTRTFVQGGAGHSWLALVYRDHSAHTCAVRGYPGVDAVARGGHVLAHAARARATARTVVVRPGGYASALVDWLNFAPRTGKTCTTSASIATIAPNTTHVTRFAVRAGLCDLQVHPAVAGLPGYPRYAQAQHEWIVGATVSAAETGRYLRAAAAQLKQARTYPTQVKQLEQLAALPNTSLTKAQLAEAHRDVAALEAFFATPGLYS